MGQILIGGAGPPKRPTVTFAASSVLPSEGRAGARRRRAELQRAKRLRDQATLNRPYLGWHHYPTAEETTPPQSTGLGTFVALRTLASEPQHPGLRVRVRAVTGAGTAGEVRLVDRITGTVIAGPLIVGTATTVEANLEGTLVNPVLEVAMKVDVEARITAGASTIAVLVVYVIGIGVE